MVEREGHRKPATIVLRIESFSLAFLMKINPQGDDLVQSN